MKVHNVKIKFDHAVSHQLGLKPWELRFNDRDYEVGDIMVFYVLKNADGIVIPEYEREIKFIFKGGEYGLDEDYVIMTLGKI